MGKKVVYLSAGHSGPGETGAVSKWMNERVAAGELVGMVAKESRMLVGMRVRMEGLSLGARVKEANSFCGVGSGVAVEVHFNAGGGSGTECVVSNGASVMSRRVAGDLAKLVSDVLGVKNRGVKRVSQSGRKRLAFVDDTSCPAVILEVCFVDSEYDCRRYEERKGELAGALAEYLGRIEG